MKWKQMLCFKIFYDHQIKYINKYISKIIYFDN